MTHFAQRLRHARTARGLSQRELMAALHITNKDTISHYEHGRRRPRMDTLILLADALDVSLDWLTGRDA